MVARRTARSIMTNLPESGWTLSIDFGTSFTVVAVSADGRSAQALELDGDRRIPSVVLVDEDATVYVGHVADELSASRPGRAVRAPKRRLGEPVPVVLGGKPHQIVDLVAALLSYVYNGAVRHQGSEPSAVRLTHPATWGRPRLARLLEAAAKAGLPDPVLVSEPVAAALAYAADARVPDGAHVAVYDLGGGTFDTTVLVANHGTFSVVGRPAGDPNLGGELFDEMLVNLVGERLDPATWDQLQVSDDLAWRQAAAALRTEVRRGKETLSTTPYAELLLPLPQGLVNQRITRDDLELLVSPYIEESVRILVQCVRDAGIEPLSLAAVYLVGGASRMPLIERSIAAALPGVAISRRGDPKTAVAIGATRAEPSESVLDLQSAGKRGTVESNPGAGIAPASLPPPPDGGLTVVGSTVAASALGTVIEPPTIGPAPAAPAPELPVPPPPPPPPVTKHRMPLIAGAAAAGVLAIGGIAFALRGGESSTPTTTTSTTVEVLTTVGSPGTLPTLQPSPPTTTIIASPSSTAAPPSTTTPPAPRAVGLTDEQATAALLTIDDVTNATGVDGWVDGTFSLAADLCGIPSPDPIVERHYVADRPESAGVGVEVVSNVLSYATTDDVNASYNAIRQAATACPNPTETFNDVTATLRFTAPYEVNTPGFDRTLGFGVIADGSNGVQVQSLIMVITKGRAAGVLQYQIVGRNVDQADLDRVQALLTAKAVKMLANLA